MLDAVGKLTKHGIIIDSIVTGDVSNLYTQVSFLQKNGGKKDLVCNPNPITNLEQCLA